ncbi:conserved exported hypothetical protein [Tenacibaculum litopenaei]|jgi:hypothetical protein|uniref:hypothetical protein n=1 Tax=Tenacibaculum litopenaei TaxID=396016 RepID=UPI003893E727
MKRLQLLFLILVSATFFSSCTVVNDDPIDTAISLRELLEGQDLWYIDYHRTAGTGNVPFVSKAFTLSFLNGRLYANNNMVDVGKTGNGFGVAVGSYATSNRFVNLNHGLDGSFEFEVVQLSNTEIRIDCTSRNVSYYLIGYQRGNFDYDKLFYDNIEYFLQEYMAWERVKTAGGSPNVFDKEHYLQFTPKNNVTFYSSHDPFGMNVDNIKWDYVGGYEVANINGYPKLKILTLNYDGGDTEKFELSVINDERIALYHLRSQTTYTFAGRGFVQYLRSKGTSSAKAVTKYEGRKRSIIKRKTVERRVLK